MILTLIDRYVLGLYVKALLLTLMVLGGMYVFIDMIGNFEELYGYAKDGSFGAFPALLFEYYGPRVLWVSEAPHLLGHFRAFDLRRLLAPGYDPATDQSAPAPLPEDALLTTGQYATWKAAAP
jgi:hypothetical protein